MRTLGTGRGGNNRFVSLPTTSKKKKVFSFLTHYGQVEKVHLLGHRRHLALVTASVSGLNVPASKDIELAILAIFGDFGGALIPFLAPWAKQPIEQCNSFSFSSPPPSHFFAIFFKGAGRGESAGCTLKALHFTRPEKWDLGAGDAAKREKKKTFLFQQRKKNLLFSSSPLFFRRLICGKEEEERRSLWNPIWKEFREEEEEKKGNFWGLGFFSDGVAKLLCS